MLGTTLSRWTMSYFAAALCFLIGAEALMAAGYGFPSAPLRAPETLLLVHLVAIGWLSLLVCGALLQFVPVIVARPLHNDTLPLPALLFLIAGLAGLLGGFLQLAGTFTASFSLFPFATAALATGFGLILYNLGRTLAAVRPLPLAARFVGVALISLVATVALGGTFALSLGLTISNPLALKITSSALPLHVVAGVGGWLTFAAMGVSYRLLAMFMLAPELEGGRPHMVLWLGTIALAVTILGGLALLIADASLSPALLAGGILSLTALGLYGADVLYLYRARTRRIIELNSEMTAFALVSRCRRHLGVGACRPSAILRADRRANFSCPVRMAHGVGTRQAVQNHRLPHMAGMLRAGSGQNLDTPGAGPCRRGPCTWMVLSVLRRHMGCDRSASRVVRVVIPPGGRRNDAGDRRNHHPAYSHAPALEYPRPGRIPRGCASAAPACLRSGIQLKHRSPML